MLFNDDLDGLNCLQSGGTFEFDIRGISFAAATGYDGSDISSMDSTGVTGLPLALSYFNSIILRFTITTRARIFQSWWLQP